jgi:hypothetical protein
MQPVLEYARPNPRNGTAGALVIPAFAILAAVGIIYNSIEITQSLIAYTDCHTGWFERRNQLMFAMPVAFALPIGAWVAVRSMPIALVVARCATWAAITGWSVCVAFVL